MCRNAKSAQSNVTIAGLQISDQPSASTTVPKWSQAAPEFPVSTVRIHYLRPSSPQRVSGESGDCRLFISQYELHIESNASAFFRTLPRCIYKFPI